MATFAARSVLRSATSSARTAAARFATGAKPKAAPSPFRIPTQKTLTARIFRSPVEMSCAVETMLPYHTATASALLTSMLSATPRSYGWTLEALDFKRSFVDPPVPSLHNESMSVDEPKIAMMIYDECRRVQAKLNVHTH